MSICINKINSHNFQSCEFHNDENNREKISKNTKVIKREKIHKNAYQMYKATS